MSTDISNHADIIDSRDIIERIEELENMFHTAICPVCGNEIGWNFETEDESGHESDCKSDTGIEKEEFGLLDSEFEELVTLYKLQEQCEGYAPDWKYGETLIRDTYFQEYAQELAEEIGAIDPKIQWPYTCIDWQQAAEELQQNYTSVDYDGVDYWIRS